MLTQTRLAAKAIRPAGVSRPEACHVIPSPGDPGVAQTLAGTLQDPSCRTGARRTWLPEANVTHRESTKTPRVSGINWTTVATTTMVEPLGRHAAGGTGVHKDYFRSPVWRGYLLAILAWGIAFGLRYGLAPWFPPGFPYLTFFPAVVLVAYYAGLRPAILTALLSALAAWWFWIGPTGFDLGVATAVALGFYVFVVAVDVFFIVGMDGATRRLAVEVERSEALAQSRDILMKEVQHRVSNNIQVVSAILSLEARSTSDPGARKALSDASARTALIASIQRSLAEVDGRTATFEDLARSVVDDAMQAAARDDVTVSIDGNGTVLSADEGTPVILIMLECVNNALEHAFPDRPGHIDIRLDDDGRRRTLEISDNGNGLSGLAKGAPTSLGLRIIAALARQLGGDWTLRDADPGTAARLSWPHAPITLSTSGVSPA